MEAGCEAPSSSELRGAPPEAKNGNGASVDRFSHQSDGTRPGRGPQELPRKSSRSGSAR